MSNRAIIEKELTQGVVPIGTPKAYQYDQALVETAVATVKQGLITNEQKINTLGNTILAQIEHGYGYPFTASTVADMTDTTKIYVYVGSETGYVDGNWYYYDGTAWVSGGVYNSTAFETDKTLSVVGEAADASSVGDFIEVGSNLFDANSIEIGKNAAGNTGYPKRAISGAIHVGDNGATVKAFNLPSNLKYSIEYYGSADFASYAGSYGGTWYTSTDAVIYNYTSKPYIRILFGSVNDANLTEADFIGLDFSVISGVSNREEYEPHKIAIDSTARKGVEKIDVLAEQNNPKGILPISGWQQGSVDDSGQEVFSNIRIRTNYIAVPPYSIIKVAGKDPNNSYQIDIVEFDESYNVIRETLYISTSVLYVRGMHEDTRYIRFLGKKADSSAVISPHEAVNINAVVTIDGQTPKDIINVMTYNIGHFGYGVSTGIPDNVYDEKLINYRRFFAEQNCDIVGMQEFTTSISQDGSKNANDELFDYLYPNSYSWSMSNWECFKTKIPVDWREINKLPTTERYYISEYITINGKVVYLINVHLTPGTSAEHVQKRIDEANDILDILADKERFIMFGDFNPEPGEEDSLFKIFSDAGYNLANCGWFGKFLTWSSNRADLDTDDPPTGERLYYIDNIITSSNITIENVERLTVFSKLSSDHIPIRARLRID